MTTQEIKELKRAAIKGDVEFLRKTIASNKPNDYYLTMFPKAEDTRNYGNIFHVAVSEVREDFIREAIKSLPLGLVQQMLLQQDQDMNNPLHVASLFGNLDIVNLILNFFKSLSTISQRKPWLEKNSLGYSPCHTALDYGFIDCGLEILKMDMELLCNMRDNSDCGLLYCAVVFGNNKFALEILRSARSFTCNGPNGLTPLHNVALCSEGEEIFRRLLEKEPELIRRTTKGNSTTLHSWANGGKLWPVESFLKSNDIIPQARRVLVDLMSITDDKFGFNPFHVLAAHTINEKYAIQIAELLVDTYKHELIAPQISPSKSEDMVPWFVQDKNGATPLTLAINRCYESFALFILSVDDNVLMHCKENALFLAIEKRCYQVVEKIIEIVEKKGWTQLFMDDQQQNVLHLADKCTKNLWWERLLKKHPQLLEGVDKYGTTVLHSWAQNAETWTLGYILHSGEIDYKWRNHLIKLIATTNNNGENPFHLVVEATNETRGLQFIKLLVKAYKEGTSNWVCFSPSWLPWFAKNSNGDGPLHLAIFKQHEKLGLHLLSLQANDNVNEVLDYYKPKNNTLILAIKHDCYKIAKKIMTRLDKKRWGEYLEDSYDGKNALHLASSCIDKDFARWMVNEAPEFITKADHSGNTPLDKASDIGADWIIQEMLKTSPLALNQAPLAWIKACKNGHISTIHAFIDNDPKKFKDHCIKHKETPFHYIQLLNILEYEEFISLSCMKDLINVQDSRGDTPLHKAIRARNIFLTEALLLNTDKLNYNIKNQDNQTVVDLLEQVCYEDQDWDKMCKNVGFDSTLKTTYVDKKTDLQETRDTLFFVAGILVIITFLSGFNLGGGYSQIDEETISIKKAILLVFLVFDAIALCCSMAVMISLIRSISYDINKTMLVIDRSIVLVVVALYSTLLAFMSGLYTIASPKSMWGTIIYILMCCFIGFSAKGALLQKFLKTLIPSAKKNFNVQFAW